MLVDRIELALRRNVVSREDTRRITLYADGMSQVTQILSQIEEGDLGASEQLLPIVYDELRKLARGKVAGRRVRDKLFRLRPSYMTHTSAW